MPNINDLYPSKSQWLKADDIPDEGLIGTIDSYEVRDFNYEGKRDRKPVIYFKEDIKPLIVVKTNALAITSIVGSGELDDWVGKRITLVVREVEFAGKQTWGIRVQQPRRQASRTATVAQSPRGSRAAANLDEAAPLADPVNTDDVPF